MVKFHLPMLYLFSFYCQYIRSSLVRLTYFILGRRSISIEADVSRAYYWHAVGSGGFMRRVTSADRRAAARRNIIHAYQSFLIYSRYYKVYAGFRKHLVSRRG